MFGLSELSTHPKPGLNLGLIGLGNPFLKKLNFSWSNFAWICGEPSWLRS